MATMQRTTAGRRTHAAAAALVDPALVDLGMLIATTILVIGLYSDGWAHTHHLVDTFFTPWHGILYSGFLLSSAVPIAATYWNHRTTHNLRAALPRGYELAVFGGPLFILGGLFDETWHRLVGFEVNVETLLSPSHLFLLAVGLLLIGAPLRARLLRGQTSGRWASTIPAWVSLGYVFAGITFFTAYIQPFDQVFIDIPGNVYFPTAISVGGILFQSALYVGFLLFALRRWGLPRGSVALLLLLSAGLQSLIHVNLRLFVVAVVAGLVGEGVRAYIQPTFARAETVRIFAALVPALLYCVYFVAFALASQLAWNVTLWCGAILLAGGMGFLVSFAFAAPVTPTEEKQQQ